MNRFNRNRSRKPRFNQPFVSSSSQGPVQYLPLNPPSGMNLRQDPRTPEQIAFELEFKKWETGFEDWKRSYANHPDRTAYYQYEKKFLDVREKLVQKRAQIYNQKSLQQQLDSQFVAASLMAESILSKFSEPSVPVYNNMSNDSRPFDMNDQRMMRSPMNQQRFNNPSQNYSRGNETITSYRNRTPPRQNQEFIFNQMPTGSRSDRNMKRARDWNPGFNQNAPQNNGRNKRSKSANERTNVTQEQNQKNVYPKTPCCRCATQANVQRPPLVGKRKKRKNAKILNVLATKKPEAIVNTELTPVQRMQAKVQEIRSGAVPKRMSGAARRRYVILKSSKSEETWTEEEKVFMEYAELTKTTRDKHFATVEKEGSSTQPKETPSVAVASEVTDVVMTEVSGDAPKLIPPEGSEKPSTEVARKEPEAPKEDLQKQSQDLDESVVGLIEISDEKTQTVPF